MSFLVGANLEFRAKEFGVFDILRRRKCGIEELLDSRRLDKCSVDFMSFCGCQEFRAKELGFYDSEAVWY